MPGGRANSAILGARRMLSIKEVLRASFRPLVRKEMKSKGASAASDLRPASLVAGRTSWVTSALKSPIAMIGMC